MLAVGLGVIWAGAYLNELEFCIRHFDSVYFYNGKQKDRRRNGSSIYLSSASVDFVWNML